MSVATITRAQYRANTPEHDLQVSVLQLLMLQGRDNVYWFAIPNAGKRSPREGARMKNEGLTAGVADLCILMPKGKACWLELKTGKGKQSEMQKQFQRYCEKLDHPYAVARSFEEARNVLKLWGAIK